MEVWVPAPTAGETRTQCCHHEQVNGQAGESCRRNQYVSIGPQRSRIFSYVVILVKFQVNILQFPVMGRTLNLTLDNL